MKEKIAFHRAHPPAVVRERGGVAVAVVIVAVGRSDMVVVTDVHGDHLLERCVVKVKKQCVTTETTIYDLTK